MLKSAEQIVKDLSLESLLDHKIHTSGGTFTIIDCMKLYAEKAIEECSNNAVADFVVHSNGLDEEYHEVYVLKESILQVKEMLK